MPDNSANTTMAVITIFSLKIWLPLMMRKPSPSLAALPARGVEQRSQRRPAFRVIDHGYRQAHP